MMETKKTNYRPIIEVKKAQYIPRDLEVADLGDKLSSYTAFVSDAEDRMRGLSTVPFKGGLASIYTDNKWDDDIFSKVQSYYRELGLQIYYVGAHDGGHAYNMCGLDQAV